MKNSVLKRERAKKQNYERKKIYRSHEKDTKNTKKQTLNDWLDISKNESTHDWVQEWELSAMSPQT